MRICIGCHVVFHFLMPPVLAAGGDVEMAGMGLDVEEGRKLLSGNAERMRRPSARSFLDYQDEDGSDSDASLGAPPLLWDFLYNP